MSLRPTKSGAEPAIDPAYVKGSHRGESWAHFRSGAVVEVSSDRRRHYPGLRGLAPTTLSIYRMVGEMGLPGHHILDAGCGSGEGLRQLARVYRQTTGIDADTKALAFARQIAKDARFLHADLAGSYRCDPVHVACFVDVLGHLASPEVVLRALLPRLDRSATLVVAEPAVSRDQCLVAPARRAYSERSLFALLARSGYQLERWEKTEAGFVTATASLSPDASVSVLADAEQAFTRGNLARALSLACVAAAGGAKPLRVEALLVSARVQIEMDCRDAATATLLEARAVDAMDPRPLAGLSRLALLARNGKLSAQLARDAVALDPTDLAALCALGLSEEEAGLGGEYEVWKVAHAVSPDSAGIAGHLCAAAISRHDLAAAITVLERLRTYAGHDTMENRVATGWLLVSEGETLKAQVEARLASSLAPNDPSLRELRAYLDAVQTSTPRSSGEYPRVALSSPSPRAPSGKHRNAH